MVLVAEYDNIVYFSKDYDKLPYKVKKGLNIHFKCLHCKKKLSYINPHKRKSYNVHAYFRHEDDVRCDYEVDIHNHIDMNTSDFHKSWTQELVESKYLFGYWNNKNLYDIRTKEGTFIFVKNNIVSKEEIASKENYGITPVWILNGNNRKFQLYRYNEDIYIDFKNKVDIPYFTSKSSIFLDINRDKLIKICNEIIPDVGIGYKVELVSYIDFIHTYFEGILRNDICLQPREEFDHNVIKDISKCVAKHTLNKKYITQHKIVAIGSNIKWEIVQNNEFLQISTNTLPLKTLILNGLSISYMENTDYIQIDFPQSVNALYAFFMDLKQDKNYKSILESIDEIMQEFEQKIVEIYLITQDFELSIKKLKTKKSIDDYKPILKILDRIQQNILQANTYNQILYEIYDKDNFKHIKQDILYNLSKFIDNVDKFLENPFKMKFTSWWKHDNFRVLENIALCMNMTKELRVFYLIKRYITDQMFTWDKHSCVQRKKIYNNALNISISKDIAKHYDKQYVKDIIDKYDGDGFILHKLNDKKTMVYIEEEYEKEVSLARKVCQLINCKSKLNFNCGYISKYIKDFEKENEIELNTEQVKVIKSVLTNSFTLMTGPPGSGKSDVVKCICFILLHFFNFDSEDILLCAPTGKAASKLTYKKNETKTVNGVTVHSALWSSKVIENDEDVESDDEDDSNTLIYKYNNNYFKHKVIVIDEISMMDTTLFELFLRGIDVHDTIVLMIGDYNQLPSIGHGDVLRCLVKSNIVKQHINLVKVYRYGEDMIRLAENIKNGKHFQMKNSDKIKWYKTNDVNDIFQKVCNLYVKKNTESNTLQVIIPTKSKEIGCTTFNNYVHDILKPESHKLKYFFQGEKIMCTKNFNKSKLFNGDVIYAGYLDKDNEQKSFCVFTNKNKLQEWKDNPSTLAKGEELLIPCKHLDWCYGITIHKSQGSEWDDIVVILNSDYHKNMLNRNLLYTAITRVKKGTLYVIYDTKKVLYDCVSKEFIRNTCLTDILKDVFSNYYV